MYDAISFAFKSPVHSRLTQTKYAYRFLSRPNQTPTTTPAPPKQMGLHHVGTGPAKPHLNNGPSSASSTDPFARILNMGNASLKLAVDVVEGFFYKRESFYSILGWNRYGNRHTMCRVGKRRMMLSIRRCPGLNIFEWFVREWLLYK